MILSPLAAFIVLGVYLLVLVVVLLLPSKSHDPQRGVAVGCLMIVVGLLALVGLILLLAMWQEWDWVANAIAGCVTLSLGILVAGILIGVYDHMKRRK